LGSRCGWSFGHSRAPFACGCAALRRVADLQSAAVWAFGQSADYKSAIRQVKNPRYDDGAATLSLVKAHEISGLARVDSFQSIHPNAKSRFEILVGRTFSRADSPHPN
jgi:hypothetical protein